MKYSGEQRERAVDLCIKYEHSAADVIHELGYPSGEALRIWYGERLEEERTGVPSKRGKRYRRYSDEQKRIAVDHYLEYGRRLSRTMRQLGVSEEQGAAHGVDRRAGARPTQAASRAGARGAEAGGGGGGRVRQAEVARGGRRTGRGGVGREKLETADAREVQGGTGSARFFAQIGWWPAVGVTFMPPRLGCHRAGTCPCIAGPTTSVR